MRLTAYLRVSSVAQIDAWGLDRQEKAIRTWAKANNHRIVSWHRDEGVPGTIEAVDRPGLAAAIQELGPKVDGILVADLDRFARKLTVQEAALAVIWRNGGRVFTATGGEVHKDDPDDPSRTLIRQVMGAVIEYEKRQAVARMRGGMLAKAATGRKATGQYAFGFHGEGRGRNRDAAPNPDQQDTLNAIMELREMGASYRVIVAALDRGGYKPKRARQWSPMTVRRIYEREVKRSAPPLAATLMDDHG